MKAMILAAGLGTRLRPYSLQRPKPLFPVCNVPLLLRTVETLKKAGFRSIVVNCHHLAEQIIEALAGMDAIILQHEEQILGTGGGLRRAAPHFGNEPVLIVNGDIYHTIDLAAVYRKHREDGDHGVTMVMHDYPRFNQVVVEETRVTGFDLPSGEAAGKMLAFTGIHVVDAKVLELIPPDTAYSIIDCYRAWLARGENIRAHVVEDIFWRDIGTPEDYLRLHADILLAKDGTDGRQGPFLVDGTAQLGGNVHLEDWACIGSRAAIGDNATICRSVVWDGAVVKDNEHIRDAIVTGEAAR
jgi:mannose-1-phosphate guanylyltransferase